MTAFAHSTPSPVSVAAATHWCLEHLDAHRAVLVGVEPGPDAVEFHVVPLRCDDLFEDLTGLEMPPAWRVRVLVCDADLLGESHWSRLALGADDERHTYVCLRAPDGHTWEGAHLTPRDAQ